MNAFAEFLGYYALPLIILPLYVFVIIRIAKFADSLESKYLSTFDDKEA